MNVNQLENCCSVVEIGGFTPWITVEGIKRSVQDFMEDEEYTIKGKIADKEFPKCFTATTVFEQKSAIKALSELGFKQQKIYSRHDMKRTHSLIFWIKNTKKAWWK